jgi:uncharacterized protein (DUF1684 family)
MSRRTPLLALLVLAFGSWVFGQESDYAARIHQWQHQKEEALRAEDGWLTVVGLFWLKPGDNSFGSDKSNDIVLPAAAPAQAGIFTLKDGKVRVTANDGVPLHVNGAPAKAAQLSEDPTGKPGVVTLGDLSMFPIQRSDRIGIRLKDKKSQARREFHGMKFFPVDPAWRVEADFVPVDKHTMLSVPNILGPVNEIPTPGRAEFTMNGQKMSLYPVREGDELFFIFKDLSSGKGTYPPGRFLYTALPKHGKVVLDFNQAVSPPCAWTDYATCPLPPKGNSLPVEIDAGEMFAGHR